MSGVVHCPRQHCGEPMIEQHDQMLGKITWQCAACDRNRRGLCRDCPAPKATARSQRCAECRSARDRQRGTDAKRAAYQRDPAARARRRAAHHRWEARNQAHIRAYRAAYRAAHQRPRDDGDRLYLRVWFNTSPKGRACRARSIAAQRRRRAAKRVEANRSARQPRPAEAAEAA